MAQRSLYEDRYALDFQSSISTGVTCTDGIDSNASGLFLMEHPSLYANQRFIDREKASATAARDHNIEFYMTEKRPYTSLPLMLSPRLLYPALRLFFQRGSLQDSSDSDVKWFYPYSYESNGGTCETWATIVRDTSSGSSVSQRMIGAIAHAISITSSDEYLTVKTDVMGRNIETNYNPSGDTFTQSSNTPLLWRNCVSKIGNGYTALETIDLKDFNISIKNNARGRTYNDPYIQKFNLGKIIGEGNLIIPWENSSTNWGSQQTLIDFFKGTLTRFSLYWKDQYVSSGDCLSINFLVRYVRGGISSDREISNEMRFILVEDCSFSSTNNKITNWAIDGSDASLIDLTFSGSETLTGEVFPGDTIITPDASAGQATYWAIEKIMDTNTAKLTANHSAGTSASGTNITIIRNAISFGLNDGLDRGIT